MTDLHESQENIASNETTQDVSKLVAVLLQCKITPDKEPPELKTLKSLCCDSSSQVSLTAFYGLLKLVEHKKVEPASTILSILTLLPSVSNISSISYVVGRLILIEIRRQFAANKGEVNLLFLQPQHPLLTILKQNMESWDDIWLFVEHVLQQKDEAVKQYHVDILRPLFLHIFCNPSTSVLSTCQKQRILSILLKHIEDKKIITLIFDLISWHTINAAYSKVLTSFVGEALEELERATVQGNKTNITIISQLITTLSSVLAASISWLIKHFQNPLNCLTVLSDCLQRNLVFCNMCVYILADAISNCPLIYLPSVLDFCENVIVRGQCNKVTANSVAASILKRAIFPCLLYDDCSKIGFKIISLVSHTNFDVTLECENVDNNEVFGKVLSSNKTVNIAYHLIRISEILIQSKEDGLSIVKNIQKAKEIHHQSYLLLCGCLLQSTDTDICTELLKKMLKLLTSDKRHASLFLGVVLYKLTRETNPEMLLAYLTALPEAARDKENVPLLLKTISSIEKSNISITRPSVIRFYLSLWKVEARTIPYLMKSLTQEIQKGTTREVWEMCVVKGIAMRELCAAGPELYGRQLVPHLSDILNQCNYMDSGAPSSIALNVLSKLCEEQVIDISGTWKALQPKLRNDKRPTVVHSLCNMFGLITRFRSIIYDIDELSEEAIIILWSYVTSGNSEFVKSALSVMGSFALTDFKLKDVPDVFCEELTIPKEYSKQESPTSRPHDVIPYVPGDCWIQLIKKMDSLSTEVCGMLITMLQNEINNFPRGLYPKNVRDEPKNLNHLPPSSLCRALVKHVLNSAGDFEVDQVSQPSVISCLKILSYDYKRILPPMCWRFLEHYFYYEQTLVFALTIAAKQSETSISAKEVVVKYLKALALEEIINANTIVQIFSLLPWFCTSISPEVLEPVIQSGLSCVVNLAINSKVHYFEEIMTHLENTLRKPDIHDANRQLIALQLERLLEFVKPNDQVFNSYIQCVTELPVNNMKQISMISEDMSTIRFLQSLAIRTAVASKSNITSPFSWMSDCVSSAKYFPEEHTALLMAVAKFLKSCTTKDCISRWFVELAVKIQETLSDSSNDEPIIIENILDVYIISVVFGSGTEFLFEEEVEIYSSQHTRLKLFPLSLSVLLDSPIFSSICPQVIEWICKLVKLNTLTPEYHDAMYRAVIAIRNQKYVQEPSRWPRLILPLSYSTKSR